MFLKVCGITRPEDARHAVEQGATALGFVFWPRSPRFMTPGRAAAIIARLPPGVDAVGVFVNEPAAGIRRTVAEAGITMVQLHGDEPVGYAGEVDVPVLRAMTLETASAVAAAWPPPTTLLLDAADPVRRGGTGTQVDWARAVPIASARRLVLAGGLTPHNVGDAVAQVRPFGVDVSSGVEEAPGVKDVEKVTRFLANARLAFGRCHGVQGER